MKSILISILLVISAMTVIAQWSHDPAINTLVANIDDKNTVPKVTSNKQGEFFVSNWVYTGDPEAYFALWLQKLDANGNKMWGDSGLLVSRHRCRSWLSDYSLLTDTSGNVLIFLEDTRSHQETNHVYGYCISTDGSMLWGEEGIQVDDNNYFNSYSPKALVTLKGNIVIAWNILHGESTSTHGLGIEAMKLDPSGSPLWSNCQVFLGSDSTYMMPNLVAVENDDFMMIWTRYLTVTHAVGEMYYKYIYAQRYNEAGQPVWAQNAPICDLDTLAYILPDFPDWAIKPDEAGGAFVGWNDGRSKDNFDNIYVQHVDRDGNLGWQKNGLPVSNTTYGSDREYPYLCYLPGTDELAAFWSELKLLPQGWFYELAGQKFDAGGAILWSDTGKVFCQSGDDSIYTIIDARNGSDDDAVVFYQKKFLKIAGTDTTISVANYAMRIDADGSFMWDPQQPVLSGSDPVKYAQAVAGTDDQFVLAWQENRTGGPTNQYGEIYAQNISMEGKTGPLGSYQLPDTEKGACIVPNPSGGKSSVRFMNKITGSVDVTVVSGSGQTLSHHTMKATTPAESILLDGSGLPAGLYLVRITNGLVSTNLKWVIEK